MENVSFYTALSDSPRSIGIAERFFVGFYADRVYCDAFFFLQGFAEANQRNTNVLRSAGAAKQRSNSWVS